MKHIDNIRSYKCDYCMFVGDNKYICLKDKLTEEENKIVSKEFSKIADETCNRIDQDCCPLICNPCMQR